MTPIVVRTEDVRAAIIAARGLNVMLDSDLARLYQVQTSALVRAMKRNQDRFPNDFAFQLTREEWDDLLCQTGISSSYGGRRTPPFVFTEQGVAMLSGVLRSERAVAVNVAIMRAFVAMRHELSGQLELARSRADVRGEVQGRLLRFASAPRAAPALGEGDRICRRAQAEAVRASRSHRSPGREISVTPWYSHTEYGYSLREVATHLGCSVTTVHRRVRAGGGGGWACLHWLRAERRQPDPVTPPCELCRCPRLMTGIDWF